MKEHEIGKPMENVWDIRYIPDEEFTKFVHELPWERKELYSIEGHMRWIIKDEDGSEYILRPQSAKDD